MVRSPNQVLTPLKGISKIWISFLSILPKSSFGEHKFNARFTGRIPGGIGTLRSLSALTLRVENGHNAAMNKMPSFGVRLRSECADGADKALVMNLSISDPTRTLRIAQFLIGTQTETGARKVVK